MKLQQANEEIDAAATGYRNEELFIKLFCQICKDKRENESNNLFGKIHVVSVYCPGLVKKINFSFANNLANGIIITKEKVSLILFFKNGFKFFKNNLSDLSIEQIKSALKIRNATKAEKNIVDCHSFITNYKL